ncbi:MAG: hypothetical protein GWO03_06095, partial [Gammaproteobacteria bacterium]|nr:hypothetical protein [Gammaproteobacteria bacterium]
FTGLSVALFRPLGSPGIALANSIGFSLEAGLLLVLLTVNFPSILRQRGTFLRIGGGALLAAAATWVLVQVLPLPPLPAALAALAAGSLMLLPFVWPELKELRAL